MSTLIVNCSKAENFLNFPFFQAKFYYRIDDFFDSVKFFCVKLAKTLFA